MPATGRGVEPVPRNLPGRDVAATIEQTGLAGKRRARSRCPAAGCAGSPAVALAGDPELLFLDQQQAREGSPQRADSPGAGDQGAAGVMRP